MIAVVSSTDNTIEQPTVSAGSLWVRLSAGLFAVAFVALVGAQLATQSLVAGKIYPGVKVAGLSLGGMDIQTARQLLEKKAESYSFQLDTGLVKQTVRAGDAGVIYDPSGSAGEAFNLGRNYWFAPLGLLSAARQSRPLHYTTNHQAQQAFITSIVTASGQAPVDATLQVSGTEPTVVRDKNGYSISQADVKRSVEARLASADVRPVVLRPSVQKARIQAADAAKSIDAAKSLMALPVTLTYNDQAFTAFPSDIGQWLDFISGPIDQKPELVPQVNPAKMHNFIVKLSTKVNVQPVTRKVTVENGVQKETQAGTDGLAVNESALAQAIAASLNSHNPVTAAVPTVPVPFKTVYNNVITLDYGRYIEINLTNQHLYVWQDHNIIFDSPITSGATGAGFATVKGLFSVKAKQTNRNLNGYAIGYNYNVFVKYWMPFYADYGMHDASWRSSFGGQDYYYGGSHGCVNMPDATAAWVFNWANVGDPVWVHS